MKYINGVHTDYQLMQLSALPAGEIQITSVLVPKESFKKT